MHLRAAEAGLALDPDYAACARVRAMALVHVGRRAEARAAAQHALRLDPDAAQGHSVAAWTEFLGRDRERSLEHVHAALRADPGNESAHTLLSLADNRLRQSVALRMVAREQARVLGCLALPWLLLAGAALAGPRSGSTLFFLGIALYVPLLAGFLMTTPRHAPPAKVEELRRPGALSRNELIAARATVWICLVITLASLLMAILV